MVEIWTKGGIPCKKMVKEKNKLQQKGVSNFKYSVRQCVSYSLKGGPIEFFLSKNMALVVP